jgi:hypothetical protein
MIGVLTGTCQTPSFTPGRVKQQRISRQRPKDVDMPQSFIKSRKQAA